MPKKAIAIIGVGNLLMGDEGVGIHAIRFLEKFSWPENVELIDAAVPGVALMHMMEERKLAIIIDCADFHGRPGDILAVNANKLKREKEEMISLHGASLLGTIALAEATGIELPEIFLVAVQPQRIEMTDRLSEEVEKALPKIKVEIKKITGVLYPT